MHRSISRAVQQHVAAPLRGEDRVVLAVSGGVDSMVLLDAAVAAVGRSRLCVATFDHGTGASAQAAASLVRDRSAALGVECVSGRASRPLRGEAQLRAARWTFLRSTAEARDARVATAHTIDDQIETVLMRILRGAGTRGIAGLYGPSDVVRPLLALSRRDVVRYARARRIDWVEDPSNASPAFLRNRLRHELLPALRAVQPALDRELLEIARGAATWRADVASHVDAAIAPRVSVRGGAVDVPAAAVQPLAAEALNVVWPDIAARIGLALDRRGTERLAAFTHDGRIGGRVQLSGGWQVIRSRDAFQLRASELSPPGEASLHASTETRWDSWEFRPVRGTASADAWSAWLPGEAPLVVRRWRPGDVMLVRADGRPRKVKYLLSDAGITGHERARWPVVLAADQIIWIPGVRRSAVATARSGRPALAFACEYISC
jgi:tRNA(Ile)-lysidine synthase